MIILKNVPFEKRARFLLDNVCTYPESPEFPQVLSEHTADIAGGLKAHQDLLRRIYGDVALIEGKSDRIKYLQLVDTTAFLYAGFAFGTLVCEHGRYSVLIDKGTLKQAYKRGSLSKRARHLEHHGFSVAYLSAQDERTSLSRADRLSISYDRHPSLVPAVKYLAESIESIQDDGQKSLYNKLGIFLKGDYETAILKRPIPRDALDPLRRDILDSVGEYRDDWAALIGALRDKCGLECSGFWHYGASPSWGVSFSTRGKKPLAIFTLGSSIVFVEFTLPLDAAERIIRQRQNYSDTVRGKIESFRCVKCPKQCKGSNMVKVDGVWLCKGRAEARRIYATLTSAQDFESIHFMLDIIC